MKSDQPIDKTDIADVSVELAALMKATPGLVDKALLSKGQNLIAIYSDRNFSPQFDNLAESLDLQWREVVNDVSGGGIFLSKYAVGLCFYRGDIKKFSVAYGKTPPGTTVLKFSIKHSAAFLKWAKEDEEKGRGLDQEKIEYAIYYLTYFKANWEEHFR